MARRYATALLCIAAIGALPLAAHAAAITWQASAGFEKTSKEGRWTPVFVDIQNTGPSRTGELRILLSSRPQGGTSTTYGTQVDIPQHSNKRYCICVPEAPVRVALLNVGWGWDRKPIEGGTHVGARDTLVVVIGGDQGFLSFLRGEAAAPQVLAEEDRSAGSATAGEFQVAHAAWNQLPDRWLGWDCADVVVLGDAQYASATPDALKALAEWVRLGGTLVVPGGSLGPTLADGPLAALLPIAVAGTTPATNIQSLATWMGAPIEDAATLLCTGAPRSGARVLCGDAQAPLVLIRSVDAGRVVMTTFDYRAALIKHWDGQTGLWRALAQPEAAPPSLLSLAAASGEDYYGSQWSLPEVARYAPEARLPSLWLVGLFLLGYIVVLVPVNYLALRRIDRMELAWLTSPLIVIAFTLAAYFIGYAVRGGQLIVNRVAVVETGSGHTLAQGRGFVGIFSPTRARYGMTLPHSAASAGPATRAEEWSGRLPDFSYEEPVRVSNIAMDMWTSQAVATRFSLDVGKGISGAAEFDGSGYRAEIRNGAPFALKGARLVIGGAGGPQVGIAAGASGVLMLVQGQPGNVSGYPLGGEPPYGNQAKDLRLDEMTTHALFMDRYRYYGYGPGMGLGTPASAAWLLAFADPAIGVGSLDRKPNKAEDVSVVLVRLPVRFASRKVAPVPQTAISARLLPVGLGATSNAPGMPGGPPGMGVGPGRTGVAVWEYTLPLTPATHRVDKLSIVVGSASPGAPAGGPGGPPGGGPAVVVATGPTYPTPTIRCSVYNATTGQWEQQEKVSPLHLKRPEQYIDAEGKLLLKQVFSGNRSEPGAPQLVIVAAQEG